MNKAYESGKAFKFSEEDVWESGCIPNSGMCHTVDIEFTSDSIQELIDEILNYYDVDISQVELNACDELGRLDISLLEDERGSKATAGGIERWKNDQLKLWSCVYTYYIKRVIREDVTLYYRKDQKIIK